MEGDVVGVASASVVVLWGPSHWRVLVLRVIKQDVEEVDDARCKNDEEGNDKENSGVSEYGMRRGILDSEERADSSFGKGHKRKISRRLEVQVAVTPLAQGSRPAAPGPPHVPRTRDAHEADEDVAWFGDFLGSMKSLRRMRPELADVDVAKTVVKGGKGSLSVTGSECDAKRELAAVAMLDERFLTVDVVLDDKEIPQRELVGPHAILRQKRIHAILDNGLELVVNRQRLDGDVGGRVRRVTSRRPASKC